MLELQNMAKLFTFVVIACCLGFSQCQNTFEGHINKAIKMMEHIPALNNLNGNLAKTLQSPEVLEMLMDLEGFWTKATNQSSNCISVLKHALTKFDNYTLNMLDATGKPPPAIRNGAFNWVGGFDMCMSNPPPKNYKGPGEAPRSHYCRATFADNPSTTLIDMKPKLSIGVCLPETCTAEEINGLIKFAIAEVKKMLPHVPLPSILNNDAIYCMKRTNELSFSAGAIIMLAITILFGIVICFGTAYDIIAFQIGRDYFTSKESNDRVSTIQSETISNDLGNPNSYGQLEEETEDEPKVETKVTNPQSSLLGWQKMLLAFSIYTNAKKIIDTKQQPGRLNCLDGIRFISMSWVILGHTYFFAIGYVNNLASFFPILFQRWTYEAIVNATFSVDSFFLLSGLLTAYMFLKEANKMGTIKSVKLWVLYFFHRYWRLTPPYMLFLGFYTALYNYMSNGPLYSQATGIDQPHCQNNWWTNLLYVNNLVKSKEMCMGWTWYLANDMQFHYLIAPLILPLIFLFGKWATISGGVIAVGSLIVTGVISRTHSYGSSLAGDSFDSIYIKPWCRVSPYIVGLMLGYLVLEHQKRRWRLHRGIVVVGWLAATAMGLSVIYGLTGVNNGSYKLSVDVAALYNSVSRFVWSLSLAWLIYACLTGNGGWINRLLSWPGFIPLSRLTYCAYLVHPVVMTFVYQNLEFAPVVNTLTMVYWFFGHMIAAYMVAFVLSLVWESPLIGLERILLKKN